MSVALNVSSIRYRLPGPVANSSSGRRLTHCRRITRR